jgi:23S rRNA pseudouridine1911/1915/1917 synthase
VHLAEAGFPILGDKIYGPSEAYFVDFAEGRLSAEAAAELVLPRHALHAAAITFPHPASGEPLRVAAELPPDMRELSLPREGVLA